MDWSKVGGLLGSAAPLIGGILGTAVGGPAGSAIGAKVGSMVAGALGVENTPDAVAAAIQADPQALAKVAEIEARNRGELERMNLTLETENLKQTGETYRKEIESKDAYVRRMRPTFGYVLAFSVLAEVLTALAVVFVAPEALGLLAEVYQALSIPQAVALAALGVYFKGRSNEKLAGIGARTEVARGGLLGMLGVGAGRP